VHREDRHLDREGEQEGGEQPPLLGDAELEREDVGVGERPGLPHR
jgi:hypothetical protein